MWPRLIASVEYEYCAVAASPSRPRVRPLESIGNKVLLETA